MEIRNVIPPAKLVFGILVTSETIRRRCIERIVAEFGPIDHKSRVEPFTFTNYYCDEMGQDIFRQYLSCERLIDMSELPAIKHRTNEMEIEMAVLDDHGRRRRQANIDPGYVTQSKFVLATTKDYMHRVYMADGIFAEATLHYQRPDGFRPFPWTYPDYARTEICEFFGKVRASYRRQIQAPPTDVSSTDRVR